MVDPQKVLSFFIENDSAYNEKWQIKMQFAGENRDYNNTEDLFP